MPDFILLMHDDAEAEDSAWQPYIAKLIEHGCFQGGSAIGDGLALRKQGTPESMLAGLAGFIRVSTGSLDQAKALLAGNPVYEAGGTVEIRELPLTE
jgi:hypothetical protein